MPLLVALGCLAAGMLINRQLLRVSMACADRVGYPAMVVCLACLVAIVFVTNRRPAGPMDRPEPGLIPALWLMAFLAGLFAHRITWRRGGD